MKCELFEGRHSAGGFGFKNPMCQLYFLDLYCSSNYAMCIIEVLGMQRSSEMLPSDRRCGGTRTLRPARGA